jgi:hypothetical protein
VKTPVAIFVRPPRAGSVKTRLIPRLGAERATMLYRAFVVDTIATVESAMGLAPELWVAGAVDDPALLGLAQNLPRTPQAGATLGERMALALRALVAKSGRGVVVGSDAPTLPVTLLEAAALALESSELVLGPTADGGFYLIGVRGPPPPVFEGVRYSTRHAFADSLCAAHRAGKHVAILPPWYDVDTPRDLSILCAHLAVEPESALATATCLFGGARSDAPAGSWTLERRRG